MTNTRTKVAIDVSRSQLGASRIGVTGSLLLKAFPASVDAGDLDQGDQTNDESSKAIAGHLVSLLEL